MSTTPTSTHSTPGTVILSGANGSLGLGYVRAALTAYPHHTYLLLVRNPSSTDPNTAQLQTLLNSHPTTPAHILGLDLTSPSSVRTLAQTITAAIQAGTYPPLRSYIWNAFSWHLTTPPHFVDVDDPTTDHNTPTKIEHNFLVGHLSQWLLTVLLLSGPSSTLHPEEVSITFIGSLMHDPSRAAKNPISTAIPKFPQDMDQLPRPTEDGEKGAQKWGGADYFNWGFQRYADMKMCNITSGEELKRRIAKDPALKQVKIRTYDPLAIVSANSSSNYQSSNTPFKYRAIVTMVKIFYPLLRFLPSYVSTVNDSIKAGRELLEVSVGETYTGKEGYVLADKPGWEEQAGITRDETWGGRLWEASKRWVGVGEEELAAVLR